MKTSTFSKHFKENKTLFAIIVVGLFLIELEIFALAVMNSGQDSVLQVLNSKGDVIHESSGTNLSDFNRQNFEQVFGPLENYAVQLKTHKTPFPFRAWFVAAVCIPIGAMMLFGFIVQAYITLFYRDDVKSGSATEESGDSGPGPGTKFDSTLNRISRMNIFNIGFLIFVGAISYWIVPNALTYLGHIGIDFFTRFKWVYIGLVSIAFCIVLWIIYLRYRLAKQSIDSQTEIQKHRMSLEYNANIENRLQLAEPADSDPDVIEYKPEEPEQTPPS